MPTYPFELNIVTEFLFVNLVTQESRELFLKLVQVSSVSTLSSSRGLLLCLQSWKKSRKQQVRCLFLKKFCASQAHYSTRQLVLAFSALFFFVSGHVAKQSLQRIRKLLLLLFSFPFRFHFDPKILPFSLLLSFPWRLSFNAFCR